MRQTISTVEAVTQQINEGRILLLAGDEDVLRALPKGDWIAGTTPYFISAEQGGLTSRELLSATDITDLAQSIAFVAYDKNSLAHVYAEAPANGFSFVVIPAFSETHYAYALNAPNYKDFGMRPLLGWVAGVHLSEVGRKKPKIFNGRTGEALEEGALVLQVSLPPNKVAEIGIINLFEQGDGEILTFGVNGFVVEDVNVNGVHYNFADYIVQNKLDTRLPLVADYYGALINIGIQEVDTANRQVRFCAPIFSGIRYKHAKPVEDYATAFKDRIARERVSEYERVIFSCNCLLNYQYSELEGKKTEPFIGPVTFGEIAYQLLNQTLVYLEIVAI